MSEIRKLEPLLTRMFGTEFTTNSYNIAVVATILKTDTIYNELKRALTNEQE